MAWTAPRTWVANEVVTAALMNTHVRDNLLVLSVHAHDGSAGEGNDELTGIDSITFDDLSADPAVAGEIQRNGTALRLYDGAAVVRFAEADAPAVNASPRTLGTGALQGAPGTHGHSSDSHTVTMESATAATSGGGVRAVTGNYAIAATTIQTVHSFTSSQKISAFLFIVGEIPSPSGGTIKMLIEADAVEVVSVTRADGGGVLGSIHLLGVAAKNTADIAWISKIENNGSISPTCDVEDATNVGNASAGGTTDPRGQEAAADLGAP